MFQMDPRTVIFVNFVYTFCVTLFLVSAFFLNKNKFKGIPNWIIAFTLLGLNFLILSLRSIIPVNIVIVVPHLLTLWAYIEVKRGLSLFYQIKNRIFTDFIFIIILALVLIINNSDARLRIISICIANILVYIDTILLFNSKEAKEQTKDKIIQKLFSLATIVMGIRLAIGLQWDPRGNPLETGNSLSTISILFFITNIIIFFTLFFIVMNKISLEKNELIVKFRSVSLTDELTGLMNRRGFKNVTKYEMNRFSRSKTGFTFAMCDIDHFKKVNDNFGHDYGDIVLKQISEILKKNMRGGDSTARWGGEEFVILLPETNIDQALNALERIRLEIAEFIFKHEKQEFHTTMSFGGCFCCDPNLEIEKVILHADKNLYKAKKSGRNKTVISAIS